MRSNYTCLFLRQQFVLPDTNNVRGLWLNAWYDDGLALWINGQAARTPLSVSGLAHTNTATSSREGSTRNALTLSSAMGLLRAGTNVFCLQAFNRSLTDEDFRIEVELAETPGTFAFATAAYAVREDATQLVVRVVRTGALDAGMTVDYATTNGSAVAGSDYEAVAGTLTFGEGQAEQPITFPILNDVRYEGTESFQLTLTNPRGGATLGSPSTATVQITELITNPPASLAVLLGSNATFSVTAAGTPPLTYQWRLDERDLVGATNASLVVSNVTLADLGSYTVVVRDAFGETASQPAWLKLARWTELVVFDASFGMAQYSNGKSWVEWLGERLCLSATGQVKNYATGGASCSDVRSQIATYLGSHSPGANTLLAPWWAGMTTDLVWNYRPVDQVVSNYAANLTQLAQGGGKLFILPTLVPLYLNPGLDSPYARSLDYQDINARMDREIQKLQTDYGLTIFRFDFSGLCTNLLGNPSGYGFTNVTSAARNYCPPGDPSKFLWWDGIHPTTALHHVISDETYRCLTPALVLALPTRSANGTLTLGWQGGFGPFRLQHCDDLATGVWQSGDLGLATNATVFSPAPQQFFRVLELGQ